MYSRIQTSLNINTLFMTAAYISALYNSCFVINLDCNFIEYVTATSINIRMFQNGFLSCFVFRSESTNQLINN